ncbi:MAG: anti-sigma factor [Gammaproteobacteria bacterium]|nr:anti-sigma factor [Gammaproteobacteria bacterium]MBU1724248.1 anti-sigma factor [Gammaproteobacteria bacterium]MBU2006324.1 anti-sigma factor [Gammaproteobacteria bacterium]
MSRNDRQWQYWLFSALSALLLAVLVWFGLNYFSRVQADVEAGDLLELRQTLLADPASLRGNWLRTLNPLVQDVQGDLVWSAGKQLGVMRFVDLPEPKRGTFYHLWLYDARGEGNEPVSGAVFRRGSGDGEWFTSFKTNAEVIEPYKFELKLELESENLPDQILLMVQP